MEISTVQLHIFLWAQKLMALHRCVGYSVVILTSHSRQAMVIAPMLPHADPPSTKSAQHLAGVGSLYCVCWDDLVHDFVSDILQQQYMRSW